MNDTWLIITALWMYGLGFITAHAFNNQHSAFWRGFIDGLTLRRIWQAKR